MLNRLSHPNCTRELTWAHVSSRYVRLVCPWPYSILSVPHGHAISDYAFFRVFPPLFSIPSIFPSKTCFRRQFWRNMWPVQLASFLYMAGCIFLSSLTLCNTSSLFTRSVHLVFSILLQHNSKLSRSIKRFQKQIKKTKTSKLLKRSLHRYCSGTCFTFRKLLPLVKISIFIFIC